MARQHDDSSTVAEQAIARTTAPGVLDQRDGPEHDHHGHDHDDDHEEGHDHSHGFDWPEAVRIAFVALAAVAVWFKLWEPFTAVSLIGIAGLLVGGWPILKEAFENILERRMTMELSMTIAVVAAAAIGQFFTALIITLFVLVAEVLEGLTVGRGRKAIRDLLEFLPREVSVRRAGAISAISAEELRIGDAILVAPGGRIPVDGTVLSGRSFVDESRITGESMPTEKTADTNVFAGSINQSGTLEIRTDRIGRDTSYGKIIEAVERAERSRAPVQRLADRLAGYLVYFALGAAALTYLITRDIVSTISVIIVAGACGIAAGTPLAILGGIGRCARLGAIVKGGVHLEALGRVDMVVIDKTGTLTFGRPEVQRIVSAGGVGEEKILDAAASAELRSEHPLGKAIVAHVRALGRTIREPERFSYTPGRGITAFVDGATVLVGNRALMEDRGVAVPSSLRHDKEAASDVFVARDGQILGVIAVSDTVRPEAKEAIDALNKMGIRTVLLTGDSKAVAAAVARQLGIEEVVAEALPEEKLARIRVFVEGDGRMVAMIGDGVNDAPALVEASVGVAMGSGTDVARESADVVLLGNDLVRFVETLQVARRVRRSDVTGKTVKDPVTGQMLQIPPLYGVNLALAGNKYQLRASLTKSSDNSLLDDSLGFYVIRNDGSIGNVQMLVPSVKNWPKGETDDFSVDFDDDVIGIGLFIVPDGYRMRDGYKGIDLTHLKFVSGRTQLSEKTAMITDQSPPVLVSYDPATGFEKPITGANGVSAYHLYGNLNPGLVSHTLRSDAICHMPGEKVGPNHDLTCARATTLEQAGVDPAHPEFAQVGFEDSATINCYEYRDGSCHGLGSQTGRDLIPDNEGGYIASIGDNSYDNVAFSIGLTSCPQKQ